MTSRSYPVVSGDLFARKLGCRRIPKPALIPSVLFSQQASPSIVIFSRNLLLVSWCIPAFFWSHLIVDSLISLAQGPPPSPQ